jgi:hypothetical protein
MKKAMSLCGLILLLMFIVSPLASVASAEDIVIDTEKGVPGFRTEPARDLPANWQYVHDHPDTSADGWFDTNAYPPGQGKGSFWYTISFPGMKECKGIWETSLPHSGAYEVFAWIPSPDHFDPYLDESTPPNDYLPTKRAQYKVFHNGGVATVTIDQNGNKGGFTSLGVFVFDSTARVELSSNVVGFWRCVAFDAVKFVPITTDNNESFSTNVTEVELGENVSSINETTLDKGSDTVETDVRLDPVSLPASGDWTIKNHHPDGWSDDIRITFDATDSVTPSADVGPDGSMHIVWKDSNHIYYKRIAANGTILVDKKDVYWDGSIPIVKVDSNNYAHIVCWAAGTWPMYIKINDKGVKLFHNLIHTGQDVYEWPSIAVNPTDNLPEW